MKHKPNQSRARKWSLCILQVMLAKQCNSYARCEFQTPGTRFRIRCRRTRILNSNRQPDFGSQELNSGFLNAGFRIPRAKIPDFRNPITYFKKLFFLLYIYWLINRLSPLGFQISDFIVFALFTYWLHWNFNLYKYLTEQSQK